MSDTYTVKIKRFEPTDPRLGRHVRHDSRSLNFLVEPVADVSTLKSIQHQRHIPTLNQGQVGSCEGNGSVGCISSGFFWDASEVQAVLSTTDAEVDETYAVGVYSDATKIDPFPGFYPEEDTGTDNLSVSKVLQSRGLISGYQHATSFDALLTALSKQPILAGTEWRNNMFNPEPDGRLRISGDIAGGHAYVLDELDVENKRIWMHNSWGDEWGVDGRAYFTWGDFESLMQADGECTIFVPITEPAPQPTPPTPPAPPQPDVPDFQKIAEEIKEAIDKLVQWFKDHA